LWRVVNFKAVALEISEEVPCAYSVGTRWVIVASLLRGSWCRMCLLPSVVVDLSGVEQLLTYMLACTWGSSSDLLLSSDGSGSVGILTLLALLICFSILGWHIRRDDQDLAI
jgi:hypothetical protein